VKVSVQESVHRARNNTGKGQGGQEREEEFPRDSKHFGTDSHIAQAQGWSVFQGPF